MNYNRLYYFYITVKHMNISRAAEELCISQPALSAQIKALEEDFQVSLLERNHRRLSLTEAGNELYAGISSFFGQEEQLFQRVSSYAKKEPMRLRFGFMPIGNNTILYDLISHFRQEHPEVSVSVARMNSISIHQALEHNELDVALSYIGGPEEITGLQELPICPDQLVVAMPPSHPLAKKKKLKLTDLKNVSMMLISPSETQGLYQKVHEMCRKEGFEPKISSTYSYVESLLSALQVSNDITIISGVSIKGNPQFVTVPLDTLAATKVHLSLIYSEQAEFPLLRLFVEEISEQLKKALSN